MVRHMREAVTLMRRDRERFGRDLSAFEAAGFGGSPYTQTIQQWIAELDKIISASGY